MPGHQRRERGFAGLVSARSELLEQLTVGQAADRSQLKQRANRLGEHGRTSTNLWPVNPARQPICHVLPAHGPADLVFFDSLMIGGDSFRLIGRVGPGPRQSASNR